MTAIAVTITMPMSTGYSFMVKESTNSLPIPGQPKMVSVISAPEKSHGSWIPANAIKGATALGNAWRNRMRPPVSPFDLAVRM